MTYIIKRSDGSFLLNLLDETVETNGISVPLIGKNVSDYGEYYNNTLVSIIENFASSQQPNYPLVGQLWYDKTSKILKVYGGDGIFESIIPNISNSATPIVSNIGDLWVDTTNNQLKFKSSSSGFTLAGPIYTTSQGRSGFEIITVADSLNDPRDLVAMYTKNKLIAVISAETFTIRDDYIGYTNATESYRAGGISQVSQGITLNPDPGLNLRMVGRATEADFATTATVGNVDINTIPPIYLTNYPGGREITTGTLYIQNDTGLKVGNNADLLFDVSSSISNIKQNVGNQLLRIMGRNIDTGQFSAVSVDSVNQRVGVLTDTPQTKLDVNGDTTIRGNLTVFGGSTYLVANDIRVNDKTIELNYSTATVTDSSADGGGVVLHGTTDHSLTWTQSYGGAWQSSDNVNLSNTSSSYQINGQPVVTSSSLGVSITSAPGISSLGILSQLTVSNIIISGNSIESTNFDRDIILSPSGVGNINVSNSKIINLSSCTNALDAVNKQYVDNALYQQKLRVSFSVDETSWGGNPEDYILPLLDKMFPISNTPPYDPFDIPDGSRARILCSFSTFSTTEIPNATASRSVVLVDKGGVQNSQDVLEDINFGIPSTPVTFETTYTVREFLVQGGIWTYVGVV